VADSSGTNDDVKKQLAEKPHRVVRLEDTDGDGRFDKSVAFADRMMFPEGAMWRDGSLYVSAPPSIWKLTDTDDDGVADRREEWFQGKTLTGCANDLHGPYAGPDGWIYWCKGAFAEQTYERRGKPPLVTKAAHIFRARPDGTGIEPVMTGGMDNPVDVVFMPNGERIFTTTFFQHPGGGRRDGMIHAIYGGAYGKVHNVLDNHPWTGPEVMPVLVHMGPAAPCGLARYESATFGPEYRDNLFACQFNLHKVSRHVLTPKGATFEATNEDFLVSPDTDFHPTDVIEDADGSLLVIDTGGWYKLCCPSSHFHKPDVLGAIYRVRKVGATGIEDPRGRRLEWEKLTPSDLTALLGDPRPVVRRRAMTELGESRVAPRAALIEAIVSGRSPEARRNAIWAASRHGDNPIWQAIRTALLDPDETVAQVAAHTIALHRDRGSWEALRKALRSTGSAQSRRAFCEALGRIEAVEAIPDLLQAAGEAGDDRALEHSITYALIELGDPSVTVQGLSAPAVGTRRAALIALDQMNKGLAAVQVAPFLSAPEPELREAAAWIVGRHPEWGDELAGFLRERLRVAAGLLGTEAQALEAQLARFARGRAVQTLIVEPLNDDAAPISTQLLVLRAMARSGLAEKDLPDAWLAALVRVLGDEDADLLVQAAATLRALPIPKEKTGDLSAALQRAARDHPETRLDLLAAVPGGLETVSAEQFAFLRGRLDAAQELATRTTATDVLAKASLTPAQLRELTDDVAAAGPIEVTRLLPAFEKSSDEAVGRKLVEALRRSPGQSALRVDLVRPVLEKYGEAIRPQAEELYSALNAEIAQQKAKLDATLSALVPGDARRGQALFNGPKAVCSTCHAIGYVGGRVGPDLTKIASIRTDRDLLESILFPSASLVRSYEPIVIATADGQVFNGLVKEETPEVITLVTGPNQDMRISRAIIEEIRPGTVSVMLAGLDTQLSPQDLADLLAFLKTCK
jgi:putative membrane-bound dehydrogenase-like protein